MNRFDGSLARKLDFGDRATWVSGTAGSGRTLLRLAAPARPGGPDKYRLLERRRRRAQINARRLLELAD